MNNGTFPRAYTNNLKKADSKIRFSDNGQYAICGMDKDGLAVKPIQKRSNKRDFTRLLDKRKHIFKDKDRNAGLQPASSPWAIERRSENNETLGLCSEQFPLASLSSIYPMLSTGSLALDVNALRVSARITLDNENIELRLPTTIRSKSADLPSQQDQLLLTRLPAKNGF